MTTDYLVLSLLEIEPMTGYEISQNIELSIMPFWSASTSQIYNVLTRLHKRGWVVNMNEAAGHKTGKAVYSITEEGKQIVNTWINSPIDYLPSREPFVLWASYLEKSSLDRALINIDKHIKLYQEQAEKLEEAARLIQTGQHPLVKARAKHTDAKELQQIKKTRAFAYYEMASKYMQEVAMAKRFKRFAINLKNDETSL